MTVLIADDDTNTRFAMRRLLQSMGLTTVEASDGGTALELLAVHNIALVVLDLDMPVLDGFDVLQAIRSSRDHAHLAVVVISGVGDETTAARAIQLGVTDFLTKPIRFEKARTRLERILLMIEQGAPMHDAPPPSRQASSSQPILVVDANNDFRYFVANVLAPKYTVLQASSGVEAVHMCRTVRPAAVIMGGEIGIFGPELLAGKLRAQPQHTGARLLVVRDAGQPDDEYDTGVFDAVLTRTFVPEEFQSQFRDLYEMQVIEAGTGMTIVRQTLVSAAQQAMGMMAHTDVRVVAQTAEEDATSFISASVVLEMKSERAAVRLSLAISAPGATKIAARLLQADETEVSGDDSTSVVGEMLNVITGRLQVAIASAGCAAKFTLPEIETMPALPAAAAEDVVRFESVARDLSFCLVVTPLERGASVAAA